MTDQEQRDDLRAFLKDRGITQTQVANVAGCSSANISTMLAGRAPLSPRVMDAFRKVGYGQDESDITALGPEDFAKALEVVAAGKTNGVFDLGKFSDRVLGELQRRSIEEAEELPGTFLMKLATYLIERQEKEEAAKVEERPPSTAVEVVDHPGLPDDRKLVLLQEMKGLIEQDRREVDAAITRIKEAA